MDRRQIRQGLARQGFSAQRHGYGLLLILILISLAFQLATTGGDVVHVVTIALQGGTFLAALWISQARTRLLRVVSVLTVAVTVAAAVILSAAGEVDDAAAGMANLLLAAAAAVAIAHGLVVHFREQGRVTVQTMFGVLCIYLLIGSFFAFAYGVIDDLGSQPLFAQISGGTNSDYLYFSFATLTTTGFGDLTAATDLGRSLAITEALIGQIYMVTVVALIVANLSRPGPRPVR
ncbi:MAG: potassium channel family protein [bacterium]